MDWTTVIAGALGIALFVAAASLIYRAMDVVEIGDLKVPKKDFYEFDRFAPHIRAVGHRVSAFLDAPDVLQRLLELRPPWFSQKPGTPFTPDRLCLLGAEQENYALLLLALDWGASRDGLRLAYLTGASGVKTFLRDRSQAIRDMFPDTPKPLWSPKRDEPRGEDPEARPAH